MDRVFHARNTYKCSLPHDYTTKELHINVMQLPPQYSTMVFATEIATSLKPDKEMEDRISAPFLTLKCGKLRSYSNPFPHESKIIKIL